MLTAYRLAWGIWIASSAIETIAYLAFTDLRSHGPHGGLLISAVALQAVLVPAVLARARFGNRLGASICGAAAGLSVAAISVAILMVMEQRFHQPLVPVDIAGLQAGYVLTILFVAGLGAGSQMGILAWSGRIAAAPPELKPPSGWARYGWSALVWIGTVTLSAAVVGVGSGNSANGLFGLWDVAGSIGGLGLVCIAPIAALRPADAAAPPGARVWRYARFVLLVFAFLWLIALGLSIAAGSLGAVYLVAGLPYLLLLVCVPGFLWAVLYGISEGPAASTLAPRPTPSKWRVALWSTTPQVSGMVLALLATAPASLGFQGIGCATSHAAIAAEYHFWEAYKGIGSKSEAANRIIFRPAVDSTACIVLEPAELARLRDPKQLTLGFAEAARSWYWLIDPNDWESSHTRDIRHALGRLIGRDFSSYRDLQAWWNESSNDLIWSGSNTALIAQPKTPRDLAHPRTSPRMQYPTAPQSAVESIRQHHWPEGEEFGTAMLDAEVRLRGLSLAAADAVAVLSGDRERAGRAVLERVTGQQLGTRAEWLRLFADSRPPVPWRMSRASALEWTGLIAEYGRTEPYRSRYVERLRDETGLTFDSPEAFLTWLQNPANTRQDEWLEAKDAAESLPDDGDPQSSNRLAMRWLSTVTSESFATPQEWVQWWQAHQGHFALSRDGRRLMIGA